MMVVGTTYWTSLTTEGTTEHLGKHIGWKAALGLWRRPLRRPEPVKVFTLLGVAEDLVSLLDLFELLRVTAFVRMVEPGKFVIGLPNVGL
jgi:hypothetical protein